ncbi:hypothetical protein [Agrococcus carbonis]|uniref:Transmembrane protein n=1 Tax=Agrococcus carbonis TaxID=684552 RepID=A0A1H1KY61_9MICO|nr:hypothetical protein [Agrococcus carbonis]SDR67264.1 hypothetical protein SAMN04489719_0271 [Agrococcus carbonis]
MQLYSSRPARAALQVLGDLIALVTIVVAVWVARQVHDAIASLGALGTQVEDAGAGFSRTLRDAGEGLAQVPLVGEGVAQPFRDASGSAEELAAAGVALRDAVDALAGGVATALWLLPALLVVLLWVLPRLRGVRRAGATLRLAATPAGRELLAVRALVGQPMTRVLAAVPDPAAAMRAGDPAAIEALASLELRSAGVRASSR